MNVGLTSPSPVLNAGTIVGVQCTGRGSFTCTDHEGTVRISFVSARVFLRSKETHVGLEKGRKMQPYGEPYGHPWARPRGSRITLMGGLYTRVPRRAPQLSQLILGNNRAVWNTGKPGPTPQAMSLKPRADALPEHHEVYRYSTSGLSEWTSRLTSGFVRP